MRKRSLLDPRIQAAARGVVTQLTTHHNSAGKPWVTFTLQTSAGSLPCMCFPGSFETLPDEIEMADPVIVHGQITAGGDREMRVMTFEHSLRLATDGSTLPPTSPS